MSFIHPSTPRVRLSLAVLLEEGREVPDDLLELLVHRGASVPIGDVLGVASRLGDTEHRMVGQENYEGGIPEPIQVNLCFVPLPAISSHLRWIYGL